MYEQFFGLTEPAFSLRPDPRFLFASRAYRAAEAQLLSGIDRRRGMMLVVGQQGTGKSTLCQAFFDRLVGDTPQIALISEPPLTESGMLAELLTQFGVSVPVNGLVTELFDRLHQVLLAQRALGKRCVTVFDDAHDLPIELLEQLWLLSNLATGREALIQIVLVGQPELLDRARAAHTTQCEQPGWTHCVLTNLDAQETDAYIHHRLRVAGTREHVRFHPRAIAEIYRASHGVPRLINLIGDRALLAGYAAQTRDIQLHHVHKAIGALRGKDAEAAATSIPPDNRTWRARTAAVLAVVVVTAISASLVLWPDREQPPNGDALYWQAVTRSNTADAERDLEKFVSSQSTSQRYNDALLRLAQLELSRGDRAAARERLSQLAHRAAAGTMHIRAVVLGSTVALDAGDTAAACRAMMPTLAPTLAPALEGDTALSRQLAEVTETCRTYAKSGASSPVDSTTAARVSAGSLTSDRPMKP